MWLPYTQLTTAVSAWTEQHHRRPLRPVDQSRDRDLWLPLSPLPRQLLRRLRHTP